ncbi:hypothetical protein [Sphingobium yanoikuyae]|uniref:hypothetical protein n=1 Tax=Sphingobium yanoikuyae TaxID=13690 RepID=UPI00345E779F
MRIVRPCAIRPSSGGERRRPIARDEGDRGVRRNAARIQCRIDLFGYCAQRSPSDPFALIKDRCLIGGPLQGVGGERAQTGVIRLHDMILRQGAALVSHCPQRPGDQCCVRLCRASARSYPATHARPCRH